MKKTISILRIAILALMGCVGTLFLFGEEQDEKLLSFILHFLFDKLFAIVLLALMFILFAHWRKTDHMLKAIDKWCDDADKAPNPMRMNKNDE
ncbi:MAG: hypothetical protein U0K29_03255 [Prevotella sp.]|nr:hypothetical protein [Prevotella sp.]